MLFIIYIIILSYLDHQEMITRTLYEKYYIVLINDCEVIMYFSPRSVY